MSERRACGLVELDRSSYRYEPRADHNAELREELVKSAREAALRTPAFACFAEQAWSSGPCSADLPAVPGGKADGTTTEEETASAAGEGRLLLRSNQEWAVDFACDALATGLDSSEQRENLSLFQRPSFFKQNTRILVKFRRTLKCFNMVSNMSIKHFH